MIFKINNILIIATLFIASLLTMKLYSVEAASNLRGARSDINPNREQRTLPDNEDIDDIATVNATTIVNNTTQIEEEDVSTWSELVGLTGEDAKAILESTYGEEYEIKIINENSARTREINFNRIQIVVNEQTQIVKHIQIG
mmetsp:Transcript_3149/g.3556  ORF Transcript_3149/g.3556 Transcript_3149/m.3556 type:complete len:142 (+) Transcript_3149:45-470(+)|eukprot:CAMPEP_0170884750 /NCGR_PEP_ID=MMETSP0734-20130129/35242_1 /TAXON_ID=186038 /ORGANISM="Fragilariopsis kerguelensis, Strain L26-C5" /LENGTH=141 /DNA_ID=CAMNT_0011269575 /DNA_START=48 /DNA_END=473 /DNA_ORIENTATION=-